MIGFARARESSSKQTTRREQVLDMLRSESGALAITAIAEQLGVHPNTVRFHLDGLIAAGRVEQVDGDAIGPGRPAHLYRARREMDRNGPTSYRLLARMMTGHVAATERHPVRAAADIGRTWGPSLIDRSGPRPATGRAALTRLAALLARLGFQPESLDGRQPKQIRLRHCPFLDVVDEHADIVCALHLGLMQGALAAIDGPVTVDQLDRFVEPDLCVAHVARRTDSP